MHDHEISHLSEIDRRRFLTGAALTSTLFFLDSLGLDAQAATSTTLAGFAAFSKSVKVTKGSKYFLVESNGLPSHPMMQGIVSWQQQIPTPQPYTGSNAWSIPIKPVIAKVPMSAKSHFLRGAIAIAVNGVPIFNALNNRGDDALLAGELDDWGGHCGRADDYHYHGTKTYPYINGGFKGVVQEIEGQVDPQALTKAFRPAGAPLKGATITSCEQIDSNSYNLIYQLNSQSYQVKYKATLTNVDIEFIDPSGIVRKESYVRK